MEPEAIVDVDLLRTIGLLGLSETFITDLQQTASNQDSEAVQETVLQIQQELVQLSETPLPVSEGQGLSEPDRRVQLAAESRACKLATRPAGTSLAYSSANRHFEGWGKTNGRSYVLTDEISEEYVRFLVKEAKGPQGLPYSFSTCQQKINGLRDLRASQVAAGLYSSDSVKEPWALQTVKDFMVHKYALEKQDLCRGILSNHLKRRMTASQLEKACDLALDHREIHWAVTLRFALLWMSSSARRNSDLRALLWRSMCLQEFRESDDASPWVGISPSGSFALAFVAAEGKHVHGLEASGCVRYLDVYACPVRSAADLSVLEWGDASKLRLEALSQHFVLRAARSSGVAKMAPTSIISEMGRVLRAAGVPCSLNVKEGAKNTVTHHCKMYALNHAALCGVSYDETKYLGSHEVDVTRKHYLALCASAMHRVAGFGPDWATQHNLGRDVDVPQYLLEIVSPGLSSLLQSVRAGHATHPMLAVLEGLAALRRVWVQDAVLKLQRLGDRYRRIFTRQLLALESHPDWPAFAAAVITGDRQAREKTLANRNFKGDPVGILHQICSRAAVPAAVAPEEAPQSSEAVTPVKVTRKRKADSYQLCSFSLFGLDTVESAIAHWRAADSCSKRRQWVGTTRKERNKQSTGFARFREGLLAEYLRREADMGPIDAISSLEAEKKLYPVKANWSQLQRLCSAYMK